MTNRLRIALVIVSLLSIPVCGRAQYQLLNSGFESWEGTTANARPSHWSSFPQADGSWAWAASTAQHYHRNGGRPGTSGSSYLTIYSRSVLGIVANGNMTTGQIHAGSTSASSSSNYNYTHRGSAYCHAFSGTPDSMYVWVSYYAASASSQGSVRAYLHGDSDFRDPNDCNSTNLYCGKAVSQFSRTTSSSTTPTWVQQRVPFVYDGTSSVNYVLMSMTTNTTAGGGSANDSLSVDDIEFIYSAWLDSLYVNDVAVADFQRDSFNYAYSLPDVAALQSATVSYVTQASDAIVTVDILEPDGQTRQFLLHVLAEDSVTSRTYIVTLTCPEPVCDTVSNLAVSVEGASALVTWTSGMNNQQWEVEYGIRGFALGQGLSCVSNVPNILLDNLEYNSEYELYVRAYCGDSSYSDWSEAVAFATGEESDTMCLGVDRVIVSEVGFTHCALAIYSPYFDENGHNTDSVAFQVVLMHSGDTLADTIVYQTDVMFDNLHEHTVYSVRARTLCDSVHHSNWTITVFVTEADTTGIAEVPTDLPTFMLYPNPARDQVQCILQETMSTGVLIIFDNMGRKMLEQRISDSQHIDISAFPEGLYNVIVRSGKGVTVQRLSIVR